MNIHQRKAIALRAAMDDLLALCEERGYVDLNDPRWHDAYQLCARPQPLSQAGKLVTTYAAEPVLKSIKENL